MSPFARILIRMVVSVWWGNVGKAVKRCHPAPYPWHSSFQRHRSAVVRIIVRIAALMASGNVGQAVTTSASSLVGSAIGVRAVCFARSWACRSNSCASSIRLARVVSEVCVSPIPAALQVQLQVHFSETPPVFPGKSWGFPLSENPGVAGSSPALSTLEALVS